MIKTFKKYRALYLLILITGLLLPLPGQSIEQKDSQTGTTNSQYKADQTFTSPDTSGNTLPKTTSDEPRELSMFFKIGIGLNIVMLIAFYSWAIRQWRQLKKQDD
ncbi:MAG: hypothetical protein OQK76_01410 [Gammaproteobacteria bacterium]|nr:hypothetical protein [Gammaproteobacteria bacterium]MCW8909253.1 hypothetical protein [Gammaproteobacteria bacterium]MCW9005609.1 hypothetical protein [Gammaproteobacteria bacterium]MCW9056398.1 hypothetical protein [Gammaproteobacteria bacterium]